MFTAIIKMTEKYKEAKVIITHPIGFANDLRDLDEKLVISDIALDMRGYEEIYGELEAIFVKKSCSIYRSPSTLWTSSF